MNRSVLAVLLGGEPIGEVRRAASGLLEFGYDHDYARGPEAVPLSVSMPLSRPAHPHSTISPWLWGLLPDSDDVRRRWAGEFGVPASDPFGLLGTPIGHDCAGAVQFCRPDELNWLSERGGGVAPLSEGGVASRLRALQEDENAWLDPRIHLQFSLAGGQRKTALHHTGMEWGIPWGAVPTTHILKPAIRGLPWTDVNEHLCLTAARILGLAAARTSLVRFEEQIAVAVQRFDRLNRDGVLWRIHQEDFCQALGVDPRLKYQSDGGPGAADIADALRHHVPEGRAGTDLARLSDALAFNWLVGAPDAHAKNYSLLLDHRGGRLAPLYDVISAVPYGGDGRPPIRLAMRIGSHDRLDEINRRDWGVVAAQLHLSPSALAERILDMVRRLPYAFEQAATDPSVQTVADTFAQRMIELMADRARECSALISLDGPPLGPAGAN